MITSAWRSVERRQILRHALGSCSEVYNRYYRIPPGQASHHTVNFRFFLGHINQTGLGDEEKDRVLDAGTGNITIDNNILYSQTRDMVIVGGPDLDPPVKRDVTYILERPTSRAYRVAYGTRWIWKNVPKTDFIFYLDDDSYLNIGKLFMLLEAVGRAADRTRISEIDRRLHGESSNGNVEEQKRLANLGFQEYEMLEARLGHRTGDTDTDDKSDTNSDSTAVGQTSSATVTDSLHSLSLELAHPPYVPLPNNLETLVMGYMMQTDVDMASYDICTMCGGGPANGDLNPKPWAKCDRCWLDDGMRQFCADIIVNRGGHTMTMGGCMAYMNTCQIYGVGEHLKTQQGSTEHTDNQDPDSESDIDQSDIVHDPATAYNTALAQCIIDSQKESSRISEYFGSSKSPLWILGMGWLFGRRAFSYIAQNADVLKKRGAADLILGYWLVPLEDLHWVDTGPHGKWRFHDYPMQGNTFTRECHDESILVHRMTPKRWRRDFDAEQCEMSCKLEEGEEVEGDGKGKDGDSLEHGEGKKESGNKSEDAVKDSDWTESIIEPVSVTDAEESEFSEDTDQQLKEIFEL